jgi:hypothetical protein
MLPAAAAAFCSWCLLLLGTWKNSTLAVPHWGQKNHAATHASNAFSQ